jgi:hypothetical protein
MLGEMKEKVCEAQSLLFAPFLDYFYGKGLIGNNYHSAISANVYCRPVWRRHMLGLEVVTWV